MDLKPYIFLFLQEREFNKSDHMSRHLDTSYSSGIGTSLETLREHYKNYLIDDHVPQHMTVTQIQTATTNDDMLCKGKIQ